MEKTIDKKLQDVKQVINKLQEAAQYFCSQWEESKKEQEKMEKEIKELSLKNQKQEEMIKEQKEKIEKYKEEAWKNREEICKKFNQSSSQNDNGFLILNKRIENIQDEIIKLNRKGTKAMDTYEGFFEKIRLFCGEDSIAREEFINMLQRYLKEESNEKNEEQNSDPINYGVQ